MIEDNRAQFIVPTQERQAVACPGQKKQQFSAQVHLWN